MSLAHPPRSNIDAAGLHSSFTSVCNRQDAAVYSYKLSIKKETKSRK